MIHFSLLFNLILQISILQIPPSNAKSFLANDSIATQIKLDLDRYRNASEIIKSRGFGVEEYDLITRDGYILTIQRIINPLIGQELRQTLKTVILQPSLFGSAIEWIINSPDVVPEVDLSKRTISEENELTNENQIDTQKKPNSLAFYLANRAYDVWLSNLRCNLYGQKHVNLTIRDPKYWNFSLDELIAFDLRDTIDFIAGYTNHSKLAYVGNSQGALIMFALLSSAPQYAEKIEPFVALGPVVFTSHLRSPIRFLAPFEPLLRHINWQFFVPESLIRFVGPRMCEFKFLREKLCQNIIFLITGFNPFQMNLERSTAFLAHTPSGASMKQVMHYLQISKANRFAHYNHGRRTNIKLYNNPEPPAYNLSNIKSKSIALFVSTNDWLAQPADVSKLLDSLSVKPHAIYNISDEMPRWNHLDFVHSIYTGRMINPRVEKVLRQFDDVRI